MELPLTPSIAFTSIRFDSLKLSVVYVGGRLSN